MEEQNALRAPRFLCGGGNLAWAQAYEESLYHGTDVAAPGWTTINGEMSSVSWRSDGAYFPIGGGARLVSPRLNIAEGESISFTAKAEYPDSWKQVTVAYSVDGETWTNAETVTTNGEWIAYEVSSIPAGNYFISFQAKCHYISYFEGGTLAYKDPAPSSVDGNGITNVKFGTGASVVNNNERPTSAPFYGNYANKVGAVEAGQTVDLDITFETGCSYGTLVWVDWNKNYNFDEDELVCVGRTGSSNPTTLHLSFDVPLTQAAGDYVMRICAADVWFDSFISNYLNGTSGDKGYHPSYSYLWNPDYDRGVEWAVAHDYTLRVTPVTLILENSADNNDAIGALIDLEANIFLNGRSLQGNGQWNTMCLPLNVQYTDWQEMLHSLTGQDCSVTIKLLDETSSLDEETGELTLKFKGSTGVLAGEPFLIKTDYPGTSLDLTTYPWHTYYVHAGYSAQSNMTQTSNDGNVQFVGQWAPFAITEENKNEILFVGSNNTIGYSKNPRTLNSCRAHFWVKPSGMSNNANVRTITIDYGDGEVTRIEAVDGGQLDLNSGWYTLDGRLLPDLPTVPGIYINNGKKIMVK